MPMINRIPKHCDYDLSTRCPHKMLNFESKDPDLRNANRSTGYPEYTPNECLICQN